jgi:hypothetical protein
MATYTTRIRLSKQATGENDSTWGTVLNDEVIDLTDFAIAGYTTISLAAGDVSLTANDGATDQARSAIIEMSGTLTANTDMYLPSGVSKSYIVKNNTSGAYDATVLINGGTGTVVPQGGTKIIFTDGVTVTDATDSTGLGLGTASTRDNYRKLHVFLVSNIHRTGHRNRGTGIFQPGVGCRSVLGGVSGLCHRQ